MYSRKKEDMQNRLKLTPNYIIFYKNKIFRRGIYVNVENNYTSLFTYLIGRKVLNNNGGEQS